MSKVEMNAYEAVLRMCADAAPNPWHPQQYSQRSGTPMPTVNGVLSELWQEGLLEKAPAHPDLGPGLRLSAKGWEVLNNPGALQRLRQGVTVDGGERGEVVRQALRSHTPPYVSRILVGMNVAVFLYGLFLANQRGVAKEYLGGGIDAAGVLHQIGLLTAMDWLNGEWWKTLTACFVHIGVLHIMMNMYMLYSAGQYIERIWGPVRFLVIYLLAGVTGSMTGVAASPVGVAGASTALFGIFAAEGVWVLFNGRYLPKQVAREWRNHLFVNALLLIFISLLPGISGWGHAGGAAAGAAAAICLHYQRFGAPMWRWAALLGLLPIPFGGLYFIDHERRHDDIWGKAEALNFKQEYKHDIDEPLTPKMQTAFQEKVRPVLVEQRAERRVDADVKAALAVLDDQRKELEAWQAQLKHLGPYFNDKFKAAREDRQKALDAVAARIDLYTRAERCLKEGENFPDKENQELMMVIAETPELQSPDERHMARVRKQAETEKERQAREKREREGEREPKKQKDVEAEEDKFTAELRPTIANPLNTAQTLFNGNLLYDLTRAPAEWVPETVKKNLAAIDVSRKQLKQLAERLPKLGQFKSEDRIEEVKRAEMYARELDRLLELAKRRLEAREKWTDDDKNLEQKVDELRSAWQKMLP